jgi:hypothetical protein
MGKDYIMPVFSFKYKRHFPSDAAFAEYDKEVEAKKTAKLKAKEEVKTETKENKTSKKEGK